MNTEDIHNTTITKPENNLSIPAILAIMAILAPDFFSAVSHIMFAWQRENEK